MYNGEVHSIETRIVTTLQGKNLASWQSLMARTGLAADADSEQTVLIFDGPDLAATGSRKGNLLKHIAVDPNHQGEDLLASVLTALRQEAFRAGYKHLFLYTKPQNEYLFTGLFFYPVVKTGDVLLMENVRGGIRTFLGEQPRADAKGTIGAAVMNCDPFTLGHQYLVETAASQCSHLYVFVLSEDQGYFAAKDRIAMVRAGTQHLKNVTVLPTGPYLISAATFPTYFLKERDKAESVHCHLDIALFLQYFVPHFSITHRFVGDEPLSPMTGLYNKALAESLPPAGVEVHILPRLCKGQTPVSASAVRARLQTGESIRELVPETTYQYIKEELHGIR